ncbi:MAG: HupE/UreJ family protein, partial [Planctomycetes bacterium]|nr:HupE/UreJ family protein [Planctomycetota bacterium]
PWFRPLVETLIAASIVYMAVENIIAVNLRRSWVLTFAFGLVHGFGFSFALRETMQFAGSHLLLSLLSFNVGVELGQIVVLVVLVPALALLFRHLAERMVTLVLSVMVAHTAWHWMVERGEELRRADWPVPNAGLITTLARWLLFFLLVGGAVWLVARGRPAVATPRADEDSA